MNADESEYSQTKHQRRHGVRPRTSWHLKVMKKRFQLFICVQVLFKHILIRVSFGTSSPPASSSPARHTLGGGGVLVCLLRFVESV